MEPDRRDDVTLQRLMIYVAAAGVIGIAVGATLIW